jgi:hypothetical protein
MNGAVSSRGCSRTYIISFLARVLEHCRSLDDAPDLPYSQELITRWLDVARRDCIANRIVADFGGNPFCDADTSSYWTASHQFFTW